MTSLPPDHRGRFVRTALSSSEDLAAAHPYERELLLYLRTGTAPNHPDVAVAAELHDTEWQRHTLNALIIGKATDEMICEGLDLPPLVLAAYRRLFFDRAVFAHALEVHQYVKTLAASVDIRTMYQESVQQGPAHVLARVRIGERPELDPRFVLKTIMGDQYDRALAHRGKDITTAEAKEARTWGRQAVLTAITVMQDGSGDENKKRAEIQKVFELKTEDQTQKPETLGVEPKDIVTT